MKPVIFLGPSLRRDVAEGLCCAEFRSPAAMGCITRAAADGAPAIVLIDGVFEHGPAVWHKEILWALSRGIAVIGASSMGALRAAELDRHGMFGAGEVYHAYASGEVSDDDEVAVVHGPAETGYMALSDAMVDIRDAVRAALAANAVTAETAAAIIAEAKSCHFKQRNLLTTARGVLRQWHEGKELESALHWFQAPRLGVKARDAAHVLRHLDSLVAEALRRAGQAPPFVPTVYLRRLEAFGYRHP